MLLRNSLSPIIRKTKPFNYANQINLAQCLFLYPYKCNKHHEIQSCFKQVACLKRCLRCTNPTRYTHMRNADDYRSFIKRKKVGGISCKIINCFTEKL